MKMTREELKHKIGRTPETWDKRMACLDWLFKRHQEGIVMGRAHTASLGRDIDTPYWMLSMLVREDLIFRHDSTFELSEKGLEIMQSLDTVDPVKEALLDFVRCVEATGGIRDEELFAVPIGDPEWLDLASVYLKACAALGKEPKYEDVTEQTPK